MLVLLGPIQLLLNLLIARVIPLPPNTFGFGVDEPAPLDLDVLFADLATLAGGGALLGILSWLATSVVTAAAVVLVLQRDRGEVADLTGALRTGLSVLVTVLVGALAIGVIGLLGFLAIVVAIVAAFAASTTLGIILLVLALFSVVPVGGLAISGASSLVAPVAVIERGGIGHTLGRVWWVMRNRFWRVIGITLVMFLILAVVGIALGLPFLLIAFFAPGGQWVIDGVSETIAQIVTVPAIALASTLVYLDARSRLEGLDLQARMRDLGS